MSVPIGDPAEISQIFDKISYEKGSSIIRMMHLFLGEEAFRWGVSKYLKKHKYGNAEQVRRINRIVSIDVHYLTNVYRIICGNV